MGCLLYDGYYNFDEWVSCVCWFPLNIVSKRIVSNLKQHDAFHLCVLKEMCSVRLVLVHLPFAVATENVREAANTMVNEVAMQSHAGWVA